MSPRHEAVIGLEVHVQLRTRTKMFCGCANRFGAEPNTLTCPVCLGYPGVLPVMNREAIRQTIAAGLLCGCEIAAFSKFDRKNYFYPDMPKNYQISQYDLPLCRGGGVPVSGKGFSGAPLADKVIGLTRIHLEEDVAKLLHLGHASAVDFNRAGVPLMEIVSEPDMRSADEAYAYLAALKQILQYAGISDCDMEKGQMRCDVNVSIRPYGQAALGTKIEIKNLNSFRSVHRALLHEIERQAAAVAAGEPLHQETRRWDDAAGVTTVLRSKEQAHDYRYFPEPDLLPVEVSESWRAEIAAGLPELPHRRRERFVRDYGITPYDAQVLTLERPLADFFEAAVHGGAQGKTVANWIITDLLRALGERGLAIADCPVAPADFGALVAMATAGQVTAKVAKDTVLPEMLTSGKPPGVVVREKGLEQVGDTAAIDGFVRQAVTANPAVVEQYRGGKTAALQFLVGQVMKASRGKASPQAVIDVLKRVLDGG